MTCALAGLARWLCWHTAPLATWAGLRMIWHIARAGLAHRQGWLRSWAGLAWHQSLLGAWAWQADGVNGANPPDAFGTLAAKAIDLDSVQNSIVRFLLGFALMVTSTER